MTESKTPLPTTKASGRVSCFVGGIRPEAVANLLRDLVGRNVTAQKLTPVRPIQLDAPTTGIYWDDGGSPLALCRFDITLAASAAAALTLIPRDVVLEATTARVLPGLLQENLHEILNVCAQLLNHGSFCHVVLHEVFAGSDLPADIKESPTESVDLEVNIQGYGGGRLQLRGLVPA